MKKIVLSCLVLCAFLISAAIPDVASAQQRGRIIITSPAPYQTVKKGLSVQIKWAGLSRGDLNLYYKNQETGRRTLIRENISPNDKNIRWNVPTSLQNGEYDLILKDQKSSAQHTIQVKVTDGVNGRSFPKANERLTLKNPNGGETFEYGEAVRIEWEHSGLGNNDLDILLGAPDTSGKIVWTYIAGDVPGNWDGYTWYPDRDSIGYYLQQQHIRGTPRFKILIVDRLNQNAKDTSDGYFRLR